MFLDFLNSHYTTWTLVEYWIAHTFSHCKPPLTREKVHREFELVTTRVLSLAENRSHSAIQQPRIPIPVPCPIFHKNPGLSQGALIISTAHQINLSCKTLYCAKGDFLSSSWVRYCRHLRFPLCLHHLPQ